MTLAIHAVAKEEGPAVCFFNTLTLIKADASQTGGAFGLIEQLAPVGAEFPFHVHHAEDESFYILEGELEFISGDKRFIGGPKTFVFLPRDIPHGLRVIGQSPARFLILVNPAGFEEFAVEMGEPATELKIPEPAPVDMEKLVSLTEKYRIETLGPLPK